MAQFTLPKNSKVTKGKHYPAPEGAKQVKTFKVYRYDPEGDGNPRWDTYDVDVGACGPMVLDVILHIKNPCHPSLLPRGRVRIVLGEPRRAQHLGLHPRVERRARQGDRHLAPAAHAGD